MWGLREAEGGNCSWKEVGVCSGNLGGHVMVHSVHGQYSRKGCALVQN